MTWLEIIDHYYAGRPALRELLLKHSRSVATLALETARRLNLPLDPQEIETAAMLHDVGIIRTDAPGIGCHGKLHYLSHGVAGARMLQQIGAPDYAVQVAQRHTGAGITRRDIVDMGLPLPLPPGTDEPYMPRTLLEKLVCYADKFYSKSGDMQRKSLERVEASMLRHSPETLERFRALHAVFGLPEDGATKPGNG